MWRGANEAAARRLVEKIMPLVWQREPDIRVRIVGARPGPWVTAMGSDKRVEITGWVESLDREIAEASVIAAPTVFGGGVLIKVLRALAIGAPVVADASSLRSLEVPGEAALAARDDADFAAAILGVLQRRDETAAMAAAAAAFARRELTWERVTDAYVSAYTEAMASR
jgi:glycosyltransferase involved in cell wall biosynthesis